MQDMNHVGDIGKDIVDRLTDASKHALMDASRNLLIDAAALIKVMREELRETTADLYTTKMRALFLENVMLMMEKATYGTPADWARPCIELLAKEYGRGDLLHLPKE